MVLSSYLLLSDKSDPILDAFTSTYGRQIIDEALDDLCILQDYVSNSKELFKYDLDVDEIADIAYSYYKYKQTGQCEKHIYAAPGQNVNRFGEPSENITDGYQYTKFEPFNMQSVWQLSQTGEGDFPVESDFNTFAKDWVKNSTTLRKIRSIKALGYDAEGNFGYNKTINPNDIHPKTLELFEKVLKFSAKADPFEGLSSRVGYTLKAVQEFLATPEETKVIFDSTYNRLNQRRVNEETGNDSLQNILYDRMTQAIKDLGRSKANLRQQLEHILHDCKVIFDARFKNVASNKEIYKTSESFIANIPEDITIRYGELSNEAQAFIARLYEIADKSATAMPRSTLAILELYLILQQFDVDMINMLLDTNLTKEEYAVASEELYHHFSIPFYFGDAESDLAMMITNGYGIAEEEDKFDKPQPQLVEFAYIAARSAQSKATRLMMEAV